MASMGNNDGNGDMNPEGLSSNSFFGGGGDYMNQQPVNFASAAGDGVQFAPSVGTIYSAFGDYEKKARERKYMIAECEDMIEGLQKGLTQRKEKNQALKGELGTLQMKAEATKASYQKGVKEKSLIERDYQKLRDEMDELSEKKDKKVAFLNAIKERRRQNVERCQRLEEQHLTAYMKNPQVAELMNRKKEVEVFRGKIRELTVLENNLRKDKAVVVAEHKEGFEDFVKQCVKVAAGRRDALQKMELNKKLEAETKNIFQRPSTAFPLRGRKSGLSSQRAIQLPLPQPQLLKSMMTSSFSTQALRSDTSLATSTPTFKRPTAFEEMDRLLSLSDNCKHTKRSTTSGNMMPPPSTTPSDSSRAARVASTANRIAQLRAGIQQRHRPPPVIIRPIPRTPVINVGCGGQDKGMKNVMTTKSSEVGIPSHEKVASVPANSNATVEVFIASISQSNDNPASHLAQPDQANTPKDTEEFVMEKSVDEETVDGISTVVTAPLQGQPIPQADDQLQLIGDADHLTRNQSFQPFGEPSATEQDDRFLFSFDFFGTAPGPSRAGNNDNGVNGSFDDSYFNFLK